MTKRNSIRRAALGSALAALAIGLGTLTAAAPSAAQNAAGTYKPTKQVLLSVGEGQLVSLPRNVVDVWTSNPGVADVNVSNPRQIGLFGKSMGEATIIATAADGSVVYGAHVRVSQNINSVDDMLRAAMPGSDIRVTHVGQIAVMNGTVASPEDSAQAEQLVRAMLNPGLNTNDPNVALNIMPVNRLKTATPLQVMLQVKIAEVSRSLVRDIGVNLASIDATGGFKFGLGQGRGFYPKHVAGGPLGTGTEVLDEDISTVTPNSIGSTLFGAGKLFGVDFLGALDLAENNGLVTTLAQPTLTALSGETASFLAGGEFPIPASQGINGTAIEFKQYGVSLAFTPTVLEGGRISMRVRPEVSELSSAGAIRLNGFDIPSLTTRRTETTVELGSGQSMMLAGLLRNGGNNSIERAPGLGKLPIIGALFRSNSFRRNETELVIVITPYLVRPVNGNQIALPTDGFRSATTGERLMMGQEQGRGASSPRPQPRVAEPQTGQAPGLGGLTAAPATVPAPVRAPGPAPASARSTPPAATRAQPTPSATPGFSF